MTADIDLYEGRRLVENSRCGQCSSRLTVSWQGAPAPAWGKGMWVLRCGKDPDHSTIQRASRTRALYDSERGWIEVDIMTQQEVGTSKALVVTLTQALARVNEAQEAGLWPARLNAGQKRLLAQTALAYGLDPLMQELTVMHGKPVITIRGRRRKDAEAKHHPSIRFRFLTQEEKAGFIEAGAFQDGDLVMYCILTTEDGNTVEGVGKVTAAERVQTSQTSNDPLKRAHPIVADNPIEMCQKRAEDRARLMAYGPIPVPTGFIVEVLSEHQVGEIGPTDAAPALPEQAAAAYFCTECNTPFQRHERGEQVWYSHRRQDGSWHNMKDSAQSGERLPDEEYLRDPAADNEPFDPNTSPPPPLPEHVSAMTHLEAVLRDQGWDVPRLQADVLKVPLPTYLRTHSVDEAYQAFRRVVANAPK